MLAKLHLICDMIIRCLLTPKDVELLVFVADQLSSKVESEQIESLIFEGNEILSSGDIKHIGRLGVLGGE
jgi:hypothetical protein